MQSTRELNILLLGETGVGKSTWINGLALHFIYPTLADAETGEMICLIPMAFTMTDDNYEEKEIRIGSDNNEIHHAGQSATQLPQTYVCTYNGVTIRIIDTPGIGDTRGIRQDRINMQNIMTHISNLDKIDGIWILLKPNNARLTVTFKFCIKELLTHLHRDACKNIVFCFTNTRGTFYRPGETLPALRKLLSDNKDIDIELDKNTIYCIDNESIKFLAAVKNGIEFDEIQRNDYAKSWETSFEETERLFAYTATLTPHFVKNTLSLNDARRLILTLSRPIAEVGSVISVNIDLLRSKQKDVKKSTKHKEQLIEQLYIPAIDLDITEIDYPRTVCTSPGCVKHIKIADVQKIDYKQHCHPRCNLTGVPSNTVNCEALQHCDAMEKGGQTCKHCKCSWKLHMHITYDCKQVETRIEDVNVKQQIESKANDIQIKEKHLETLQSRIKQLENERKRIIETSAKFACFLKNVAIAPYNDAIAEYIEHLIAIEQMTVSAGGNRSKLESLRSMRAEYDEEVAIIDRAWAQPQSANSLLTSEDMNILVQNLYKLKIYGRKLAEAVSIAEKAASTAAQYSEKPFVPQNCVEGAAMEQQQCEGRVKQMVKIFDRGETLSAGQPLHFPSKKPNLLKRIVNKLKIK